MFEKRRVPVRVAAHRRRTRNGMTTVDEHQRNLKMIKNARAIHRAVRQQMDKEEADEKREAEAALMD